MKVQLQHPTRPFTPVELMIVVAMLGILAAIAIPALSRYLQSAEIANARAPQNEGCCFDVCDPWLAIGDSPRRRPA